MRPDWWRCSNGGSRRQTVRRGWRWAWRGSCGKGCTSMRLATSPSCYLSSSMPFDLTEATTYSGKATIDEDRLEFCDVGQCCPIRCPCMSLWMVTVAFPHAGTRRRVDTVQGGKARIPWIETRPHYWSVSPDAVTVETTLQPGCKAMLGHPIKKVASNPLHVNL